MNWVYAQIFVRNRVFCAARFTYTSSQPLTSVRNAMNLWTFVLETTFAPGDRDSLPYDAHALDRNILFKFIFLYLSYILRSILMLF